MNELRQVTHGGVCCEECDERWNVVFTVKSDKRDTNACIVCMIGMGWDAERLQRGRSIVLQCQKGDCVA